MFIQNILPLHVLLSILYPLLHKHLTSVMFL